MYISSWMWILAQAADGAAPAAAPAAAEGGGPPTFSFLLPFLVIGLLFWLMLLRPEKRKQAELKALLDGLKQNDRVVTYGGMYGVVTNVQRDADRVTLRVDESNNTKINVTFASIARILNDASDDKSK